MRIQKINLESFGQFTDTEINLDHPKGGLRIVVGPNEAGKSTLLQAIRVALFGPQGKSTVGSPTTGMRLGFDFESKGAAGTVQRSGSGGPTLASGQPFGNDELAKIVGVDRELFERLFTINHDELRRYGEPLLQSSGGIGELIFGAALGGQGVKEVGEELRQELEALFAPAARARVLNKAIDAVKTAEDTQRASLLTIDTWSKTKSEIERLSGQVKEIDDASAASAVQISGLERINNIRPRLVRRSEASQRLAGLVAAGDTPPAQLVADLAGTLEQGYSADTAIAETRASITKLTAKLDQVPNKRGAFKVASAIASLNQQVAVYRTATSEVARLAPVVAVGRKLKEAEGLRSVVVDVEPLKDTTSDLMTRTAALAGAATEAQDACTRLGIQTKDLAAIPSLAVPAASAIEAEQYKLVDLGNRKKSALKELKSAQKSADEAQDFLNEIEDGKPVATKDDIATARSTRDQILKKVRKRLTRGNREDTSTDEELAQRLGDSVSNVDGLTDSVLEDTDRSVKLFAAQAEVSRASDSVEATQQTLVELEAELAGLQLEWTAMWKGLVALPGSPEEMRTWRDSWSSLCDDLALQNKERSELAEITKAVSGAAKQLRVALQASNSTLPSDAGFLSLLDTAQRLLEEFDSLQSDRAELAKQQARIDLIDQSLAPLLGLLGAGSTAIGDRAIEELDVLRQEQSAAEAEVKRLTREISEFQLQLAIDLDLATTANSQLSLLADQLSVPLEDLPLASTRYLEIAEVRQVLAYLDEELVSATGLSVEALLAEAEAAGGPDEVNARLDRIQQELTDTSAGRDELIKHLTERELEFKKATGGSDAAVAQQEVEEALAGLGSTVEKYVQTALAKAILDQVLEDGGRGSDELIERAGQLFAHLTSGEFTAIGMEQVGQTTVAVAERSAAAGGGRLFIPSLSDGTQDQLWLALRLAGVFRHIDKVGPVPVIIDDVLVNFDDERTARALEMLADLAEHTQVVVITHHPHLVAIAQSSLGADLVQVSELGRRPHTATSITQVFSDAEQVSVPVLPLPTEPKSARAAGASTAGAGSAGPAGAGSAGVGTAGPVERQLLLDALAEGPGIKSDLLQRTGLPADAWASTIRALLDDGLAELNGRTYSLIEE
ncbi:MAG: AAA family ATPase [Actinomycetes bacterium]